MLFSVPPIIITKIHFYLLNDSFAHLINLEKIEVVTNWINEAKEKIKIIKNLHHKQIAHYDFTETESINFNFYELISLNKLSDLAQKIINYYGKSFIDTNKLREYYFPIKTKNQNHYKDF